MRLRLRRTLQEGSTINGTLRFRQLTIDRLITVSAPGVSALRWVGGATDRWAGSRVGSTSWSSGSTAPLTLSSNRQLSSSAPSYRKAADRSTSLQGAAHQYDEPMGRDVCVCVCVRDVLSTNHHVLDTPSEPPGHILQSDWQTRLLPHRQPTNEKGGWRQTG